MTNPSEDLLSKAASLQDKLAAAKVLWKYSDPEGNDFYLLKKQTGAVRSPYSGKSFTGKPERFSLTDLGKELKADAKAEKKSSLEDPWKSVTAADPEIEMVKLAAGKTFPGVLWEYADEEGNKFYLPKKQTTVKSPFNGKVISGKPQKNTLSDVSQDLKGKTANDQQQEAQEEGQQKEASADLWKVDSVAKVACDGGSCKCGGQCGCSHKSEEQGQSKEAAMAHQASADFLAQGEEHPALKVLLAAYTDIVKEVKNGHDLSVNHGGRAGEVALYLVKPKVEQLAKVAAIVAKQMGERFK